MKKNILINIVLVMFLAIPSVSASDNSIDDLDLEVNLLTDIFETMWWDTLENIDIVNEFMDEYDNIDLIELDNSAEFQELQEFMNTSIFK